MKNKTIHQGTLRLTLNGYAKNITSICLNNKYFRRMVIALMICVSSVSHSQIINTIAGDGVYGYFGDGGTATAAEFALPSGIALDASGNVYTGDHYNSRVRIVNTSGVINTFAGNGTMGFSGDGGQATAAELAWPTGVGVDASGTVYIADYDNNRIRMVNTSGIISTFAGNGAQSFGGDGGPATAAQFYDPTGVWAAPNGDVYIADHVNGRIRVVNTSGIINTVAGNGWFGYSGDGGQATDAELCWPTATVMDSHGNLFIADQYNNRVRMINTSGVISTIAGNGYNRPYNGGYSGDGGPATAAELYWPTGLVFDKGGDLLIADSGNNCIRMINTSGIISTIAGNGFSGYFGDGGQATAAELMGPEGVALDASGNVYIADTYNYRLREVTGIPTGINTQLVIDNPQITVYPVPNNGNFTITGLKAGQVIEIYDYLGRKTLSEISSQHTLNMNISNYTDGVYFLSILNKDGTIATHCKIVKAE